MQSSFYVKRLADPHLTIVMNLAYASESRRDLEARGIRALAPDLE
jgi:hypothetical protein